jgi:hypothetical protein
VDDEDDGVVIRESKILYSLAYIYGLLRFFHIRRPTTCGRRLLLPFMTAPAILQSVVLCWLMLLLNGATSFLAVAPLYSVKIPPDRQRHCGRFLARKESTVDVHRHGPIRAETVSTTSSSSDSGTTTISNYDQKDSPFPRRSLPELKQELLDLLPRLTGQAAEYRTVEQLVNALESHDEYVPPQTLPFFTLATQGSWQLLFSTQLWAGPSNPRKFRLREMMQIMHENDNNGMEKTTRSESLGATTITITGNVTNRVVWDWAQSELGVFDCTGTFSVECTSLMTPAVSGSRMALNLTNHVLRLGPGSAVPDHVPELVAH